MVVSGKMRDDAIARRDKVRTPRDCMMNGTDTLETMERMPKRAVFCYILPGMVRGRSWLSLCCHFAMNTTS